MVSCNEEGHGSVKLTHVHPKYFDASKSETDWRGSRVYTCHNTSICRWHALFFTPKHIRIYTTSPFCSSAFISIAERFRGTFSVSQSATETRTVNINRIFRCAISGSHAQHVLQRSFAKVNLAIQVFLHGLMGSAMPATIELWPLPE